jgi:hypothetical protein
MPTSLTRSSHFNSFFCNSVFREFLVSSLISKMKATLILLFTTISLTFGLPVQDNSPTINNRLDIQDGLEDIVHDVGSLVDSTSENLEKLLRELGFDVDELLRG